MPDSLHKKLPAALAVPLYGRAIALRVMEARTWYVGSYEELRQTLNPLRVALGYGEIATYGGVRKGLEAARELYGAYVYADQGPLLVPTAPLLMESVIRREYGKEVLDLWRQILYERGYPIADRGELDALFGAELPPLRFTQSDPGRP